MFIETYDSANQNEKVIFLEEIPNQVNCVTKCKVSKVFFSSVNIYFGISMILSSVSLCSPEGFTSIKIQLKCFSFVAENYWKEGWLQWCGASASQ